MFNDKAQIESRLQYDEKMKKITVCFHILNKNTDKFTKLIKLDQLPTDHQDFFTKIAKDKSFQASARYQEKKSPARLTFYLVKALVDSDEERANHLRNIAQFHHVNYCKYFNTITKRIEADEASGINSFANAAKV